MKSNIKLAQTLLLICGLSALSSADALVTTYLAPNWVASDFLTLSNPSVGQ